uniref:Uncharacterized protein n=1 Tax=viral metagenome TaxID=1070528 RepID=A0A6M3XPX4_9ZZZZ
MEEQDPLGLEPEEGEESESSELEGKEKAPDYASKSELEDMRRDMRNQQMQLTSTLADLTRALRTEPQKREEVSMEDDPAWGLAKDVPQILPQLVGSEIEKRLERHFKGFEDRIMAGVNKRDSAKELKSRLLSTYREELSDPNSPILQNLQEARQLLEPLLEGSERGSDRANQIAFLLAAALTPDAVAKRQNAKTKAESEARERQKERASAMGGVGRRSGATEEPALTDEDYEMAYKFGIDLEDPKERKEILRLKKQSQLYKIKGGSMMQEED